MAAPAVFQAQGWAANIDYVLGPLIAVVSIIALAKVARAVSILNIALAITLMVLPWLLCGGSVMSSLNNLVVGGLVIVLCVQPGKIKNTYASWNRLII